MTHSGGKPHTNVGDRGQRYEVRFDDEDGIERVLGWASTLEGVDAFKRSIELHPTWKHPKVIDRAAPMPGDDSD